MCAALLLTYCSGTGKEYRDTAMNQLFTHEVFLKLYIGVYIASTNLTTVLLNEAFHVLATKVLLLNKE